jgi:hypothetical protein
MSVVLESLITFDRVSFQDLTSFKPMASASMTNKAKLLETKSTGHRGFEPLQNGLEPFVLRVTLMT